MKTFKLGELVETNEDYYMLFGRKVVGRVTITPSPFPEEFTAIICIYQEGKMIPNYQNNHVLMTTDSLQKANAAYMLN